MPETIVERKPRPRDRVWIRLSGGRFFAVPEAAATHCALGAVLSDEDIGHLKDDPRRKAVEQDHTDDVAASKFSEERHCVFDSQ